MKLRPLPKGQDWTPYAYLVYLVYFVAAPFFYDSGALVRVEVVAATLLAIPLYFLGYWINGHKVLWIIGAFVVLGTVMARPDPGSSVFFVYGACFLGKVFDRRRAFLYLGALIGVTGLAAWVFQLSIYCYLPAIVFSSLVGSIVIQQHHDKRVTRKLIQAQEEVEHLAKVAERERIARDLHDLLGHTLSVIVLKSELASRLTSTNPERAATEIRDVERISRDALAQVRAAVRGYQSAGFASELRAACETLQTAGLVVESGAGSEVEATALSPAQEGVLALALREAVTNVVRHAQASVCRLSLKRSGGYCELEVADNGCGGDYREGAGLSGMRQRVESLGGALECDGSNGTLLRVKVPV